VAVGIAGRDNGNNTHRKYLNFMLFYYGTTMLLVAFFGIDCVEEAQRLVIFR
ncbi:unnamed protein product, partial [Sphenostylis stenocarpa]